MDEIHQKVLELNGDEKLMGVMTLEKERKMRENYARESGMEAAEARSNALIQKLIDAGRIDDLRRSAVDDAYRKQLYEEFGL